MARRAGVAAMPALGAVMMLAMAAMAPSDAAAQERGERQGTALVGERLPHIAALDDAGTPHSASGLLAGPPPASGLVVQFMTVDCKPCRAELEALVRDRHRLDAAGIRVLIVNLMDDPDRVASLIKALGADVFPVVRDRTGAIVESLDLAKPLAKGGTEIQVPLTFLVDARGILKRIVRRYHDGTIDDILGLLAGGGR